VLGAGLQTGMKRSSSEFWVTCENLTTLELEKCGTLAQILHAMLTDFQTNLTGETLTNLTSLTPEVALKLECFKRIKTF